VLELISLFEDWTTPLGLKEYPVFVASANFVV